MKLLPLATLLTLYFACSPVCISTAEQKGPVFSTWEGFEVDKCASIWLIKRFINKNAVIKFFPKGEIIKEGMAFDTPEASFRRYHNMSAFESMLKHYGFQAPALIYLGRIIHDIEINVWEQKILPETSRVQNEVNRIIFGSKGNEEVIEKSCKYFDALFAAIQSGRPAPQSK